MSMIIGGVVFPLQIESASICVICGYNSSSFGVASSLRSLGIQIFGQVF
jgi:hypothetical protein